jgi:hypothetical protein
VAIPPKRPAGPPASAPSASGSPTAKTVRDNLAAATKAAEAEATEVARVSKRRLDGLLKARPDARFAALAEAESVLTPEDRLALLDSLRNAEASHRPIRAGTASRLAIWRSRLPYRLVPIGLGLGSALLLFGLALVAWYRTPERWVTLRGAEPQPIGWRMPDGMRVAGRLDPGSRALLWRRDGADGVLRSWVAQSGYAEARVPLSLLATAP